MPATNSTISPSTAKATSTATTYQPKSAAVSVGPHQAYPAATITIIQLPGKPKSCANQLMAIVRQNSITTKMFVTCACASSKLIRRNQATILSLPTLLGMR